VCYCRIKLQIEIMVSSKILQPVPVFCDASPARRNLGAVKSGESARTVAEDGRERGKSQNAANFEAILNKRAMVSAALKMSVGIDMKP